MKKLMAFLLILFYANFAFGEYITTNVTNGCGGDEFFSALFEPNTYTCASGYYLPANTDGCAACLSGHTCSGGTYAFNETYNQGIIYTVPFSVDVTNGCDDGLVGDGVLRAIFEPNEHNCNAGYYLPANVDACTQCPANSYCVGGTYSFNENIDQGISACATGYSAPAGSSVCAANTISITWDHADAADITANNAGNVTYDGDIRTPLKAQHINGKIFTGWTFNAPE